MKKVFKTLNIVIIIVLITIAIGVSYIAIPFFGNQALIVRSGSMTPVIDVGSVAVVRATNNNIYKAGDVIAFRSEKTSETITTHRIVKVIRENGVFYKTRGDANNVDDIALVSNENILGKTFIVIPYIGKILAFAKSDIGFPALIIFPAIIVILLEAWSIFKEIRKNRRLSRRFGPEGGRINDRLGFVNFEIKNRGKYKLDGLKLFIPLIAFSLIVPSTFAFFSDSETSTGNIFQAAEVFPTPITTPSGNLCDDIDVDISGNGAGSVNDVIIICKNFEVVEQINTTDSNTIISTTTNTGNNNSSDNTNVITDTLTGSSTSTTTVTQTSSTNTDSE